MNLDDIKQMLAQSHQHTLSLYLDVDNSKQENQASNPAWRTYLRQAVNQHKGQMQAEGVWQAISDRLDAYFDEYRPNVKGLAIFFTPEDEQVFELPVGVTAASSFGKPLIAPLLWAIDEYERYLIVMVDQEKARLITAYLGSTTVEDRLEIDLDAYDFGDKSVSPTPSGFTGDGQPLTQGSNRDSFEDMINEHVMRFYRDVVEQIKALNKQYPQIRIVIGGAEEARHTIQRLLPEQLADSVVAVLPIPMRLNDAEILEQILPEALNYERAKELELVHQVIDFAKSGGRGALGKKAVQEALTMQRVEMLVLPYPHTSEHEATELSMRAFESGGSVELVHGEAAEELKDEGGIAARLYYAL